MGGGEVRAYYDEGTMESPLCHICGHRLPLDGICLLDHRSHQVAPPRPSIIWWCIEHRSGLESTSRPGSGILCHKGLYYGEFSCRLVKMGGDWTPERLRHLANQEPYWSGIHRDLAIAARAFADLLDHGSGKSA